MPLAWLLYRTTRPHAHLASAAVLAVGLVAFAAAIVLEVSTALGRLSFAAETIAYYPVLGGIGVWLVVGSLVAVFDTDLPRGPLGLGAVIGVCWFVANVLFGLGGLPPAGAEGPLNDATDSGLLLLETAFLLQPFWGLWLGRALRPRAAGGGPPTR